MPSSTLQNCDILQRLLDDRDGKLRDAEQQLRALTQAMAVAVKEAEQSRLQAEQALVAESSVAAQLQENVEALRVTITANADALIKKDIEISFLLDELDQHAATDFVMPALSRGGAALRWGVQLPRNHY